MPLTAPALGPKTRVVHVPILFGPSAAMGLLRALVGQVLVWGLWGAAESFGVRVLLKAAYSLPNSLRLRKPSSKSLAASSHWHAARLVVAVLYLAYCVTRNRLRMPPSAYKILQLHPSASDQDIKSHFRHLAKVYHPDKAGYEYEDLFLQLRHAYSILSDPIVRFAYDRFGPDIESWQNLSSVREFMFFGMEALAVEQVQLFCMQILAWMLTRSGNRSVGAGSLVGTLTYAVGFFVPGDSDPAASPANPFGFPTRMDLGLFRSRKVRNLSSVFAMLCAIPPCIGSVYDEFIPSYSIRSMDPLSMRRNNAATRSLWR